MNKKNILDSDYSILFRNIPPQVPLDSSSLLSGIGKSGSIFSNGPIWLLISGGAVVLIGHGNMEHYVVYARSVQFLLLMPGISVTLQGNVVTYFSMIKSVADYDILSYVQMWNLPGLNQIIVDPNQPIFINGQMQNIGY
jgi:hypothetical protein